MDEPRYTYTQCVSNFIHDIARDPDFCTLSAVHNWFDDIEKFGAIQVRPLVCRPWTHNWFSTDVMAVLDGGPCSM